MDASHPLGRFAKDTLFYGMGDAMGKFVGFFLFPVYTRVLTQAEFGAQDLVFTASVVMSYLLVLGLDAGAGRHYFDARTDGDRQSILSTWLWFELLISVPACLGLILLAPSVCTALFGDGTLAPLFQLAVAAIPLNLAAGVALLTLRLTFQSARYGMVAASGVLVQATAAILFVVVMQEGVRGVFLANIVTSVFRAGMGVSLTYRHLGAVFSARWLRPMLIFGLPLVPASLSLWVLNYSNRYFLVRVASLSDIGLLSVGLRISSIVAFVMSAFQIAWGPFAYSLMEEGDVARRTYSRVLTSVLVLSLVGTVTLTVFAREVISVLATPAYQDSAAVVPWLCCAAVAWGATCVVSIGCNIAKKSYHVTVSTICGASVNTTLNFLLIPRWGIVGAAAATMLGSLAALAYGYRAGQHFFRIKYQWRKLSSLVGLATAAVVAGALVDRWFWVWDLHAVAYKIPIYLGFLAGLVGLGVVGRREFGHVGRWALEFARR